MLVHYTFFILRFFIKEGISSAETDLLMVDDLFRASDKEKRAGF